jgi:hypothetical protein
MDKNLFFYELEGRGYIFQNKKWDEAKHVFEDDMLNMAWEMWSSAKHSVKAQAVPKEPSADLVNHGHQVFLGHFNEGGQTGGRSLYFAYKAMIEAQEQSHD